MSEKHCLPFNRVVVSHLVLGVAFVLVYGRPVSAQSIWAPADTVNYSDSTTAATIILARARHYHRDSIIRNYSAIATTRLDAGIGRRRFGFIPPFMASEIVSRVDWQYPNDP